jgi:hypothetical protein
LSHGLRKTAAHFSWPMLHGVDGIKLAEAVALDMVRP